MTGTSGYRFEYHLHLIKIPSHVDRESICHGNFVASFPPPVFDCILYAKTEGEGLGERVTCVTSGRREARQGGGVPDEES